MINDKKHRTAIGRTKLSLPAKFLSSQGLLTGRTIDIGSGRGFDSKALGLEQYDPHFSPEMPAGKFDTVMSNYVVNVLTDEEIPEFLDGIRAILNPGGKAYISIRADVKKEGWTKIGTYQRNFELDLELMDTKSKKKYRMYVLEN